MKIILPTDDNEGNPLEGVHQELRKILCREFSGFTAVAVLGGWLNPRTGEIIEETGISYSVATDQTDAEKRLRQLARWAGSEANQESVYTRRSDGKVEIVDTSRQLALVFSKT